MIKIIRSTWSLHHFNRHNYKETAYKYHDNYVRLLTKQLLTSHTLSYCLKCAQRFTN